jgi:hypothetical protein
MSSRLATEGLELRRYTLKARLGQSKQNHLNIIPNSNEDAKIVATSESDIGRR